MSISRSDQNGPIPAETGKVRGCKSFWGLAPSGDEPEASRGLIEKKLREYVCGTRLACSAWVDAFEDKRDQPLVVLGTVDGSWVSGSDLPFNHSSHDWVFNVDLDDEYLRYHSDRNKKSAAGRWLMHIEWELNGLRNAYAFLPAAGDRMWVVGRWVFDCGHPENCKTEIHPPEAVASWRAAPFVDDLSGDPVEGVQVKVIVSGNGGVCYPSDIVRKDLHFVVPLPQRPDPNAELVVQIESNGRDPEVLTHVEGSEQHAEIALPFRAGDELPSAAYLATVQLGWKQPATPREWRHVVVRLDSISVFTTHDVPADKDGEWNLWVSINGVWTQVLKNHRVEKDQTLVLDGSEFTLTVPRPASLDDPVITIESTGWDGDSIDKICMFEEEPAIERGFPDFPDLPGVPSSEEAFKWMLEQAGKIQNERLGDLHATHSWDDLAAAGSFSRESELQGKPDFALHYSVHPQ